MDLEKLTVQDLLKTEGFADRCRIARRYPLAMMVVREMQFCEGCNDIDRFFGLIPPIPAGEWNAYLEALAEIFGPAECAKPAVDKPAEAAPAAKAEKPAEAVKPAEGRGAGRPPKVAAEPVGEIPDFDKLSNVELRDFCVKNSVISRIKKDMGNSKRESMIKWCKEHFGAPTAAKPAADKSVEVVSAEKTVEVAENPAKKTEEKPAAGPISPYEGLTPKELFCLCRERGLTVAERQEVSVYIQALGIDDIARESHAAKEAEKEAAEEATEKPAEIDITAVPVPDPEAETEDFDDWDDVPEPEEKKPESAAADDDDEWDI